MIQEFSSPVRCKQAWDTFISRDNQVVNNLPTRILSYCLEDEAEVHRKGILMLRQETEDLGTGFAFMTPPHRLVLSVPYPDDFESLANRLIEKERKIPGVVAARDIGFKFANCWKDKTQAAFKLGHEMTVYELRKEALFPERSCPGNIRIANMDDHAELTDWLIQFEIDANLLIKTQDPWEVIRQLIDKEEIFIWENSSKERMGCTRRLQLDDDGCCLNLVYTPQSKRNQGVASQLVAAVSQAFLERNPTGYCCLFTDNANPTSNSIYQKIGYQEMAQFVEIDFL